MRVKLAVVQPKTLTGNEAPKNVDRAVEYIQAAAKEGAKFVLLPETYPGPFTLPINYSAGEALSRAAREEGVYVVAGAIEPVDEKSASGPCHVCLYLYDPRGKLAGKYRRTTPPGPWIYEGGRFWDFQYQAARELPVFETEYGKVGLLVCSEVYVPELSRIMALKGAAITFLPAGLWSWELHATWRTLLWARAIENLMYIASCRNVLGGEDGLAMIAGPEEILLESRRVGVFTAELDLGRIQWLRETLDGPAPAKPWRTKPGIFKQWRNAELYRRNCPDW